MEGAAATVHDNFKKALEICGFYEDSGGALMDQGIRMEVDISLTTTLILKMTCRLLKYRDPPFPIMAMS